ncbi:nucleoside 2-deoxyribosyltransferase [Tissierella sp. MSJ-40]|uniref:Nucleoside 2-deoxyribosyltransferase n=1 Tax=Tissierella simiarum TaxID=2841534 RepID=A0ABS6E3K1_9FIRM|nr:nucleoside 2-deoxyribosyltransferase [Tissierella simiarum]MBU5437151.1 nucleoside 2-deoxyribosyltransferase [Tissierella simiarum]
MRVYIGIKYHENYSNKSIVDKISSIFEKRGYETICIVRDIESNRQIEYNPHELMKLTFEKIDMCDLVVIELSEKGVGLGIEAGYAYAKGIPVITIAKGGSDISETLVGISNKVLFYDDIESMGIQLDSL